MKAVYVDTLYSLFLALLLCDEEETFFFIGKTIDKNIKNNLKNKMYLNNSNKNRVITSYKVLIMIKIKKIEELYIQDHIMYGQLFLNIFKGPIYLLEDGLRNYNTKILDAENKRIEMNILNNYKAKLKYPFRLKKKFYKEMGLSDRVNKIFLTGLDRVPGVIQEKTTIVNIEKLWEDLPGQRKERIKEIFNIDVKKFKIIEQEDKNIILFTQPLSEDGILDEHEKIEIYSNIIKNYDIAKLVIKMHPREKTDYRKYFKDVVVMDEKIPMELLSIMGIEFKKYVTIFSTAALTKNKNIEVDWYGTKIHPKLLKWFGDI